MRILPIIKEHEEFYSSEYFKFFHYSHEEQIIDELNDEEKASMLDEYFFDKASYKSLSKNDNLDVPQ